MKAAIFYGIATVASLGGIAAEAAYARRKQRDWYDATDTITNLNVGAGNVLSGLLLAALIAAGYGWLHAQRVADVTRHVPGWAVLALGILLADFLQYWTHRLSHRVSLLWAGHVTHHSSARLNLSTGVRINWLYRGYAWMLYAPMPLLGFSFETFVAAQAVIGTYNLFMHTRLELPVGVARALGWVLVTPASHGLHHASDPRHFGNYGAALIVWDRLFGTYRELAPGQTCAFGIGRSLGASPLRLNFHFLVDLWRASRAQRSSYTRLLLGCVPDLPGSAAPGHVERASSRLRPRMWGGLGVIAVLTVGMQAAAGRGLGLATVLGTAIALVAVTAFGMVLDRST